MNVILKWLGGSRAPERKMGLHARSILISAVSLLLLAFVLVLYTFAAARHLTDFEENTCEMTYMFEYPQYVKITLEHEVERRYPRYGLYAYGEGYITERIRRMHFSGIPVLFIPGNAGSHQQVRSLASVCLRKSMKVRTPFHFDFFAVSFGKDYSGLYGGVLMDETYYVAHSIRKILSLYKGSVHSVILIGHSMGGVIAKGSLLLTPYLNTSSVSMILNLATPHVPMLVLDSQIASYYRSLEEQRDRVMDPGPIIVSIGGGPRDILVTSAQTIDRNADINVLSTSIPDVWRSVDHLSILWCKQLVLAIVRALFDSVDYTARPPRLYQERPDRLRALEYHFHRRASGKRMHLYKEKVYFESGGEWIEDIRRQFTWTNSPEKRSSSVYLMIRLGGLLEHLTVETVNLEAKDWLFACTASRIEGFSRVCEWGWNITNKTRITPDPMHRLKRSVDLDLRQLAYPGATHVIVKVPSEDLENRVIINVDIYSLSSRTILVPGRIPVLGREPTTVHAHPGAVRLYAELENIESVVIIEFQFEECEGPGHFTMAELLEPIYAEATQTQFFTALDNGPKRLKLQAGHKYLTIKDRASLRLTLDPACRFGIRIQEAGLIDRISCTVRDRWPLLHITMVSLLLLFLSMRLEQERDQTPSIVVTICLSIYYGMGLECCVALALLTVLAMGIYCAMIFMDSVVLNIIDKLLARCVAIPAAWSDWLLGGMSQLPFVTALLVLSVVPATCGALAMLISLFLCFRNLAVMYHDFIAGLFTDLLENYYRTSPRSEPKESSADVRREILNQLLLFLLCCFAAANAIPSALVWAENFRYDITLSTEDPLLLKSWLVLVACSTSGLFQIPTEHQGLRTHFLANTLRLISWIVLSMGAAPRPAFYQRLMPPTIAGATALIVLNYILPKNMLR